MLFHRFSLVAALLLALGVTQVVHAEQPRDWMVAAQPGGTYLNVDAIFPGVQLMLEHRKPIYGQANELDLRVNALPTLLFYESQADVDLRIVILTLGASVGFRSVFHNLSFAPNEDFRSHARLQRELGGQYDQATTGFGEGRVNLSLPLNDSVVLVSVNAARFESGDDRTFDWRLGIVRDSGMLIRSDTTLFIKHRSFGAFGPQVQVLNYALNRTRNTQVNYGFTFTTRPGLRKRNDIFFLSVLFGIGGTVNGLPTEDVYGAHLFKVPIQFQLAYRTVLEIAGPSKPGE